MRPGSTQMPEQEKTEEPLSSTYKGLRSIGSARRSQGDGVANSDLGLSPGTEHQENGLTVQAQTGCLVAQHIVVSRPPYIPPLSTFHIHMP